MSVRISLTVEASEMFLSLHMIFSLERAAIVWTLLERTSGFDPSLEMIDPRYLKFSTASSVWPSGLTFYLDISLEAIWVVCHHVRLVWTNLHCIPFGGCIESIYQDASFFFLFCIYDNAICKAEDGNESSSDASWSSSAPHMILSRKTLKRDGESRYPCRTTTVVLNQSPVLSLNRTALWALSYRFSMTRVVLALTLYFSLLEAYEDMAEVHILIVLMYDRKDKMQGHDEITSLKQIHASMLLYRQTDIQT